MKVKLLFCVFALTSALAVSAKETGATISGKYLEVRSCDVYTGSCVANSEMNIGGKEGMLVWSVSHGNWKGVSLDGLNVIAVLHANGTLGDLSYEPRRAKAVLILDQRANAAQQTALEDFARAMAGNLIDEVVSTRIANIAATLNASCQSGSCATVKAGDLVAIDTRCFKEKDLLCGNENNYYPPLTQVNDPFSAFTEVASFNGKGLNVTWTLSGKRSAYLGTFAR